jgi:hypothetical protein
VVALDSSDYVASIFYIRLEGRHRGPIPAADPQTGSEWLYRASTRKKMMSEVYGFHNTVGFLCASAGERETALKTVLMYACGYIISTLRRSLYAWRWVRGSCVMFRISMRAQRLSKYKRTAAGRLISKLN